MAEADRLLARRAFAASVARAAGVALPVVGLIGGAAPAFARGEQTDLAVLAAAIALEHHAIAVYDAGLRRGLFPAGLRDYAVEFAGDHEGHRDTQIAIAEERGGRAPEPLGDYRLAWRRSEDLLREAARVELAAQDAYTALISQIRTRDYLLSAAFILVDEVRHLTVWRRALGVPIY
ncbi:MAG: DUF4439 domain-containing protein [Vicinamibacteria bacterium]